MNHKNGNLEQSLQQFVNKAQARDMADDILQADSLFEDHPAPSVDRKTVNLIYQNVHHQLEQNRQLHKRLRWFSAAAVAVILLAGFLILQSDISRIHSKGPLQTADADIDQLETLYSFESSLADIDNEITLLSEEIDAIDTATFEPFNSLQLIMSELEEIESTTNSTEFWKG